MRFRGLADAWPEGPVGLASELARHGFEAEASSAFLAFPRDAWSRAHFPRSSAAPDPGPDAFCFLAKDAKAPVAKTWAFVIVDRDSDWKSDSIPTLRVQRPEAAMDLLLRRLHAPEWSGASAPVPKGVLAEAGVVIGPEAQIGEGTILEAGVRIGARVRIGRNCRIGANSRIADDCEIGDECTFTGSVSIGGQGFGFVQYPGEKRRRPRLHAGRVLVAERVRLGAFVAIDRGVFEDTLVGAETAMDNIVQIGHNSKVGRQGVLCAFVGLSGSTQLGDRVTLAGLVGTKDHVKVGHDVTVAAQSGISCDISDGQIVKGYPPRPLKEALKLQVLAGKLPELFERVKKLEDKKK